MDKICKFCKEDIIHKSKALEIFKDLFYQTKLSLFNKLKDCVKKGVLKCYEELILHLIKTC